MKKCLFYGNCQVEPLKEILSNSINFSDKYQIIPLPPVHLLDKSHVGDLEQKIALADLFVYQLVSDNYQGIEQFGTNYLCDRLSAEAQKIAIPGAYFTGYHPATINLKDAEGNKINEPCDYHDVNLLYLFERDKTVAETVDILQQDNFYQSEYILNNLEITLNELRRREQTLDINISNFIKQNYQKQKLFHTINHPNIAVLNHIAKTILKILDLPTNLSDKQDFTEALDFTDFPIYPAVANALNLQFSVPLQYKIKGEILDLKQAIELFFDFYAANKDLVKLNILQHQEKYAVSVCGIQIEGTQIFNAQVLDIADEQSDNSEPVLDCMRQQTFQDLLELAEQHCNNELYLEAISLCEAALKINSASIQAWRQLANCYEARGEIEAALDASDRALALDPEQADSAIHRARLLELQGKSHSAKELYQQAIALDEEQPPWVYRHFGNVLLEENDPESAITAYQKAIAINPDFGAQIYLNLGEAYEARQQWQQAKDAYDRALNVNPDLQEQIDNKLDNIKQCLN